MSGRFEGETDPRALNAPILEFDPTREAIIEATRVPYIAGRDGEQREMPPRVVLCYFQDVIEKVVREHGARPLARLRSEIGPNDVYLLEREVPIALAHPRVGASGRVAGRPSSGSCSTPASA